MKAIAEETARATVRETFAALGVDVSTAEGLRDFQRTWDWAQRYRRLSEKVGSTMVLTVVTVLTGGALTALWVGLQSKIGK